MVLSGIKAPKNGYVYIYLSNENDDAVYFDNFTVSYTRGRIIEENHYYAFGLRIAGISSRKFDSGVEGDLINHYLYNDKEFFEDAGLGWYDYGFRNYDPQIGRFTQLDPLTWDYPYYTPYQYAGNEPIANVDLDGLEPLASNTAGDFFMVAGKVDIKTLETVSVMFTPKTVSSTANLFNLTKTAIPTLANMAAVHSEQSAITNQLKASVQNQISTLNPKIKLKPQGEVRPWDPMSRYSDFELGMIRNNIATDLTIAALAPEVVFGRGAFQFGVGYHYGNSDLMISGGADMIAGTGAAPLKYLKFAGKGGVNLTESQLKSISSYESQIAKHQTKLAEYIKNPMKFDNKGFLKNAPNDEVRQKIIQTRIKHITQEIQTFQNNIQKILNGQ